MNSEVGNLLAELKNKSAVAEAPEPYGTGKAKTTRKAETGEADPISILLDGAGLDRIARRRCSFDIRAKLADEFKAICVRRGVAQRDAVEALFEFFVTRAA